MVEMSEKNTKKQILEAYQASMKEIKRIRAGQLDAKAEKSKARAKELKELTKPAEVDETLERLYALSDSVPASIQQNINDIKEHNKKVGELEEAIEFQKKELEELYGISVEAETLAALVDTRRKVRDELDESIELVKKNWAEEKAEHDKTWALAEKEAEQEHSRRLAEWKYEFDRQVKQQKDKLEDELAYRKKEFQAGMDEIAKQEAARCEELNKREEALSLREGKMQELEETIERLKSETDQRVMEASQAARDKAQSRFGIEVGAIKKTHEAELTVLKGKNEALLEQVINLREENGTLAAKLNDAYSKIQDVALKSLESQGNARMVEQLSRNASSEQPRQGKN